ncbi:MAG: hypothetical protein ABL892_10125, partial [Thiobacillaceae bacterium]
CKRLRLGDPSMGLLWRALSDAHSHAVILVKMRMYPPAMTTFALLEFGQVKTAVRHFYLCVSVHEGRKHLQAQQQPDHQHEKASREGR